MSALENWSGAMEGTQAWKAEVGAVALPLPLRGLETLGKSFLFPGPALSHL